MTKPRISDPARAAADLPSLARRAPRPHRAWTVVASLVLAGCGGGLTIGFGGGGDFDHSPPAVSLAAASTTVAAGQSVMLVAAAADESGIDTVAFFRLDPGVQQPLGTLGRPPYELSITAPTDGRALLRVFARAIDNAGKRADSNIVEITITP